MPIPYMKHDMKKIAKMVDRDMAGLTEEDCEHAVQESYARSDAELKAWLAQYDDEGRLKPGIFGTRGYIPNRAYEFLSLSEEEKAAFVISQKKRLGLL